MFFLLSTAMLFFGAVVTIGIAQITITQYEKDLYRSVDHVPPAPVALIFGAGVKSDGTPTDALRDRIQTGVALYNAGKVRKLLMTGDNGSIYYDEVTAMKAYAMAQGVPEQDIVLDYAGFRTYDSCYRARDVFGLWNVIAVSQEFHLPRILYTCNNLGIRTKGFVADQHVYLHAGAWEVREFLARYKAWLDVEIHRPLPKFLGKKEKVF